MRYILLSVSLLACYLSFAQIGSKQITLEDICVNNTFAEKNIPGFNGMKDGKRYSQIDKEGTHQWIRIYDLANGKQEITVFDNQGQNAGDKPLSIEEYTFSEDEQKMLLFTEGQHIFRHSTQYHVYLYDIKTKALQLVDTTKILHATLSPDGNMVAFVKNNNLYYKDLKYGQTITVTTDGEKNKIINGNCDWVYEEEFSFTQAYQWSPDSKHIAFYRFDESDVPKYTLAIYKEVYPTQDEYKYPKAGERNSIVQIKLYDVNTQVTINAQIGTETDQYIPRIKWSNNPNELCIQRMNRLQNKLELLMTNANSGKSKLIYKEESKYYLDVINNLEFLPDNSSFIFTAYKDGYDRVCKWDWKLQVFTKLSSSSYDVDAFIGIDKSKELVYYTAAASPLERKLYCTDLNGNDTKCLTEEKGTHSITGCKGSKYFLDKYSTLNTPSIYYLRDTKGAIIRTLEDNKALKEKIKDYALGKISFTQIPGANETMLNAWVIKPVDFDKTKKYPVLMYQYSGPGSQEVSDRFPAKYYFWHEMLAQKGYIVVCVDGTGTGFRGEKFKKKTYKQLGKLESDDQIAAAKYLGSLAYVDKNRIGIWGWSYGGFMSSTCILKGNDVFKMAIAVAPVTNWRYYDNIYTERYMQRPLDNAEGYDQNAPEKMAAMLKGKFLLIHGTGDDNVHFQNSVMLTDALIKENKEFESEYYPNRAHGISGGNTRIHLFTRMTNFILQNL
ncbi:MAG: DPP IV N-terminal domain-containing protein [Bacteroidota bacterium]